MGFLERAPAQPAPGSTVDSWRRWYHRHSTRFYGPNRRNSWLSWIGEERLAVGSLPTGVTLPLLRDEGITDVVNCRSTVQTWLSQDLAAERAIFGPGHVVHAPMWDFGQPQHPRLWSAAARYVADLLTDEPTAGVLIHCHQGRRRSILLTYAVLRLRGHDPDEAAALIADHRAEAQLVRAYARSVERWLDEGAAPVGRLR